MSHTGAVFMQAPPAATATAATIVPVRAALAQPQPLAHTVPLAPSIAWNTVFCMGSTPSCLVPLPSASKFEQPGALEATLRPQPPLVAPVVNHVRLLGDNSVGAYVFTSSTIQRARDGAWFGLGGAALLKTHLASAALPQPSVLYAGHRLYVSVSAKQPSQAPPTRAAPPQVPPTQAAPPGICGQLPGTKRSATEALA